MGRDSAASARMRESGGVNQKSGWERQGVDGQVLGVPPTQGASWQRQPLSCLLLSAAVLTLR